MDSGGEADNAGERGGSRRRLYVAVPPGGMGGGGICALDHARVLAPFFDETELVFCEQSPLVARAQAAGVPYRCWPFEHRGIRTGGWRPFVRGILPVVRSRWAYLSGLRRLLKDKPGLLHVHSRAAHLPYALLAGCWARVPTVVTVHEPWTGGGEAWSELWMIQGWADRVVFLTHAMKRQYPRLLSRRAAVVYNPCALRPEKPPAPPAERPRMVLAARMTKAKGTDLFLQICLRLRSAGVRFDAWLVGSWPSSEERAAAAHYIERNGLAGEVSIRGLQEDMDPVYAQMDVLLLPTRRDSFPRVVMEAMCRGIPVVASRVDGVPEMVADGVTGFLVEPGDVAGFAAAAQRLLEDAPLRRQLGAAGRERARTLFAPETYCEKTMALYRELEPRR